MLCMYVCVYINTHIVPGLYGSSIFLKILFISRERAREGEREREKHQSVASHMPPAKDLACNSGMYGDWESNW